MKPRHNAANSSLPMRLIRTLSTLFVAGLACAGSAWAQPCAANVSQLRALLGDSALPLVWEEISMSDGRPLVLSLDERDGSLALAFVKTGEGLWAQGRGVVCRQGAGYEARFGEGGLQVTPAANWLLRIALQGSGSVQLRYSLPPQLRVAAPGWNGTFVPGASRVGLRAP